MAPVTLAAALYVPRRCRGLALLWALAATPNKLIEAHPHG